jgi:hypothetical protein
MRATASQAHPLPGLRYIGRVFGSHLSIAGGMCNALIAAEKLGLETVQVFT